VNGRGKSGRAPGLSHIGDDYGPLASLAAPKVKASCRGCAGQFDDAECRHPHIDKRACWHELKRTENAEFTEALSRVHSHLIVLAAGQDAILRALRKRGSRG
jgi:hypothetical protein